MLVDKCIAIVGNLRQFSNWTLTKITWRDEHGGFVYFNYQLNKTISRFTIQKGGIDGSNLWKIAEIHFEKLL